MKKPKKRSNMVDNAIKRAYAILAKHHFDCAKASIGALEGENPGIESTKRMKIIEDYLERAGAEATRYNF